MTYRSGLVLSTNIGYFVEQIDYKFPCGEANTASVSLLAMKDGNYMTQPEHVWSFFSLF